MSTHDIAELLRARMPSCDVTARRSPDTDIWHVTLRIRGSDVVHEQAIDGLGMLADPDAVAQDLYDRLRAKELVS